jgi:predicted enzyme related to lactoylglutathione lyase
MPTRDTPWPAGTPCWVDYAAEDQAAAQEFYGRIFGWTFTEGSEKHGGYAMALADGREVAGVTPKMADQPAGWSTYLATDDVHVTAKKIDEAGGTVVAGPHDIDAVGSFVFGIDPTGLAFGAWQSGEHPGFRLANEPNSVIWDEALSADPSAARAFYGAVFGLEFAPMDGAPDYQTFALPGGTMMGGIGAASADGPPLGWQVCFAVRSADDTVAAVEAAGGRLIAPIVDAPYGRFATLADPWGASFEIDQPPHFQ